MAKKHLQQLLTHLHQEIAALDNANSVEKKRLEGLIQEIDQALEKDEPEAHLSLVNSFRGKLIDFENEHPTASGVMQRLMQALSDMGV